MPALLGLERHAERAGYIGRGAGRRGEVGGMTLIETLLAMSILVMVAGTLAALANAVQMNTNYSERQGLATQHARVAIERIERMASEATASNLFPGLVVLEQAAGGWRFPDTLVVWHPPTGTAAADPRGLPRFNELVFYYPNPSRPAELLEVTQPRDTRPAPAASDTSAWASEMAAVKKAPQQAVLLTNLLRSVSIPLGGSSGPWGAVRFEARLRPSAEEWSEYQAGRMAWRQLSWVQGIYGARTGLRQSWLRVELQLMPGAASGDPVDEVPAAFFGSAARYYEMRQ